MSRSSLHPVTGVEFAALWGDEHPDLGELAVDAVDDHLAVALSAGRLPKPYWHLDPNEDAVLALRAPGGTLLVAADGHHGFDAAAAAVTGVYKAALTALEAAPVGVDPETVAEGLALAARDAVAHALHGVDSERQGSRTALTMVVAFGDRAAALTFGDTSAVRLRSGKAKSLTGRREFLGPFTEIPAAESVRLRPDDTLLVCTDGITDYLGRRWTEQLAGTVAEASSAGDAGRRLARLAMDAGAGDHLALAVAQM